MLQHSQPQEKKNSACISKSRATCQGPWDSFPEGTGQEGTLVLVSLTRLNRTPGNMLGEGDHPGQRGGKTDASRKRFPISNLMTL